jgi:predicted metal-dependent hydrolase
MRKMQIKINQTIHSNRKTLALIVKPDGSLIVRAPLRDSNESIQEFVEKNVQWIKKKQAEALATVPLAPKQYIAGEMFMYLGNAYPLEIVKEQKKSLLLDDRFKLAQFAQSDAASVFEHWYRVQARQILYERVAFYSRQHDFQYRKIGITSARTRWGSCSGNGSLNFSWRLIMAPVEVVDYVVVHELVHTIFHNHSTRFWNRVERIVPDYKERRKWLKKNGQLML